MSVLGRIIGIDRPAGEQESEPSSALLRRDIVGTQSARKSPDANETPFFARSLLLVLALLFLGALAIRLYHIDEPPLGFHATRQYRSLLIARGYYFETLESLPQWKKEVAKVSAERQGILEPPIMESVVALAYRLVGGEQFWVPRSIASVFWLLGGVFLYFIARRISSADAALFSTAFYLLLPFSVIASRSFQPDPLMIMLQLLSILAILRYRERPTASRLAVAATASALACFVKPVSLFIILGVFVSISAYRQDIRKSLLAARSLLFVAAALLPTIAFYLHGIFIGGFLRGQAQASFLPQFLIYPAFWRGWLENIGAVVGFAALVAALLGTLLLRGLPKSLMTGMWSGYVVFVLVFGYHSATHDYYHLQLIPIVALGSAPVFALVMANLSRIRHDWPFRTPVWSVLALAILLDIGAVGNRLNSTASERELVAAREIGEIVGHSTRTIFLSSSYGLPLEYHGELSGLPWPISADLEWEEIAGTATLSARERFDASFSRHRPEYFIVLDLPDFEKQADLKSFLQARFPVIGRSNDYLVFDLKENMDGN